MAIVDAVDVIRTKRDGGTLSPEHIDWVIDAYTSGVVKDEQMAALAMAIFLRGMNREEIARWTDAMIRSGQRMDFSGIGKPTADKHSTGGVGDKITLPLAPLVACFGVAVPQLSGRGLGHTGGTLDKLESIPGWRAQLSNEEIMTQLGSGCGAVICAAGVGLAPADKKLYALRDITSTVESIPLIASSIMSKKIAEGTGALVLDVKVGSGAFMKDLDTARELARTMVDLGRDAGVATRALLTDMSVPLGRKIGNALEVEESVEVLAGAGPSDVVELTCELARNMLDLAGVHDADVEEALRDGRAMDRWRQMIREQGGEALSHHAGRTENSYLEFFHGISLSFQKESKDSYFQAPGRKSGLSRSQCFVPLPPLWLCFKRLSMSSPFSVESLSDPGAINRAERILSPFPSFMESTPFAFFFWRGSSLIGKRRK